MRPLHLAQVGGFSSTELASNEVLKGAMAVAELNGVPRAQSLTAESGS